LKGTDAIIEAFEGLEGAVLKIIENQPHEEVLRAMQEADVIIDQLLSGWYGMVAVEAWALGKPVICYIRPDLWAKYDVPACPPPIQDAIREFIKWPHICEMWGKRGRAYVERVHDIRKMDLSY
jgi:glycosyltransferase involved in cell wall biosynthesis